MNEISPPIAHGSPSGYERGCTTSALCPRHRDPDWLTCAEAEVRRRGDFDAGRLPSTQPLPRRLVSVVPRRDETAPESKKPVHGTPWGYARGCRSSRECPHWRLGRVTCQEARKRYFSDYARKRRTGDGAPLDHGTSRGYAAGCRGDCPGDENGRTCREARREYMTDYARSAGVRPAEQPIPPGEAAQRVKQWADAGQSIRRISMRTGVGRTTVSELLRHAQGEQDARALFSRTTIARILSAPGLVGARPQGDTDALVR